MPISHWLILFGLGFLVGSIPCGLIIARMKGVDIRKVGSGNIGATNVGRVLGKKFGLLCFFLDMLKGFAVVLVAGLVAELLGSMTIEPVQATWWLLVMVSPVLGHVFNPWLGFKGGKGVATSLGALLGVYPALTVPGGLAFLVWVVLVVRWRYVSLGSLGAAASLPVFIAAYFAYRLPRAADGLPSGETYVKFATPFLVVGVLLAVLVFVTHRTNIARLRAGTENKVGQRKQTVAGMESRVAASAEVQGSSPDTGLPT
ncbi:MAG TPA: glycerol-3-phosphate 1-O-acyltransferase PlsY [Phycisphaerales bacterium]|nr:glycerol-3-phosphate 1-O-acyltransferase PlsY [Phycisphaerales bacterium]